MEQMSIDTGGDEIAAEVRLAFTADHRAAAIMIYFNEEFSPERFVEVLEDYTQAMKGYVDDEEESGH